MGLFDRKTAVAVPEPPAKPGRSLVASALRIRFDDSSYASWRFRDEAWQRELWRLYRITPELRAAATWVGQCCSRVRIYVADVDELGRIQGETKNKQIQALSDTLLGGPTSKGEHLRMMGIDLSISGECYIVGKPDDKTGRDKWYIVTPTEFRRIRGSNGDWDWAWGPKGNPMKLDLENQVITRVWTPDPERIWCADSPARSCSMILRELEQLTKLVGGEIDSRLIGNGLLIIPNDLDLPQEENTTNNAESLMIRLATAGAASLRGEGTALGVLPHIIEAEDPSKFQHLTFSTELSKNAHELRAECIERLGVGMDMPPEVLSGMGDTNHWCMSTDTEILTQDRGWVNQTELSVEDMVLTLDHESGTSEWQPVQDIYRADVVDEPMLEMEGQNHSSLSTMGHRWPIVKTAKKVAGSRRRWTTSQDGFAWLDRVPMAAPCSTLRTEAKYLDDFVRLVAAYTSDGTLLDRLHRRAVVRIPKFQEREIVELRRVMASVYGPDVVMEYNHPASGIQGTAFVLGADYTESLLDVVEGEKKVVRLDFINELTLGQLEVFLQAMIEIGDGVTVKGGARVFYQVELERLAAIEHAAVLAGYAVHRGVRTKNTGFSGRPLHWISVSKSRTEFSPMDNNPRETTYTGTVWCPTTPNGTWFARRNGKTFFTGNSGFLIDGYGIKVWIEPLMNRICQALTEAYLVPALTLMGKDPGRYTYAFDTSPLQLRPQRLQDALNLYEKGIISAEAVRDAGFFRDSDKPEIEESAGRTVTEVLLRDPQLFQNQAVREAAGIPESVIPQLSMVAPTAQSIGLGPGGGGGSGPPPPMPPPTGIQSELPDAIPDTLGSAGQPPRQPGGPIGRPPDNGPPPTGLTASAMTKQQMGIVVVAEASVRRALELANKKNLDKNNRNRWPDVPADELHTRNKVEDKARASRLLLGAFGQLDPMIAVVADDFDTEALLASLTKYCTNLLIRGVAHEPPMLFNALQVDGVIRAS